MFKAHDDLGAAQDIQTRQSKEKQRHPGGKEETILIPTMTELHATSISKINNCRFNLGHWGSNWSSLYKKLIIHVQHATFRVRVPAGVQVLAGGRKNTQASLEILYVMLDQQHLRLRCSLFPSLKFFPLALTILSLRH